MSYRPGVDVARLVSAILIVCFHSLDAGGPGKTFLLAGLAYFLLLTFCLQAMAERAGSAAGLGKRASRLLRPWLFWSLLYGLLRLARRHPALPDLGREPGALLYGPEIHLWFLPFAFLGGLIGTQLLRAARRLPATGAVPLLALGSAALAGCPGGAGLPDPFAQWAYALPLLPLGLAIGLAQAPGAAARADHAVILAAAAFAAWRRDEPSYLLGAVALAAAIRARSRDLEGLRWLAGLCVGVYLMHPAVFLVVHKLAPASPWYLLATAGVVGSAVVSAMVASSPQLAALAFGSAPRPGPATRTARPAPAVRAPIGPLRGGLAR